MCVCLVGRLEDVCSHSVMMWHECVHAWPGSLALPLAARHEVFLICWSNPCQYTPGAVTLEGQEARRQCVLYCVVHRTSAVSHPLRTAVDLIWWPTVSFSFFFAQTRVFRKPLSFIRQTIYRLCTHNPDLDVPPKLLPEELVENLLCLRIGVFVLIGFSDNLERMKNQIEAKEKVLWAAGCRTSL